MARASFFSYHTTDGTAFLVEIFNTCRGQRTKSEVLNAPYVHVSVDTKNDYEAGFDSRLKLDGGKREDLPNHIRIVGYGRTGRDKLWIPITWPLKILLKNGSSRPCGQIERSICKVL